MSAHSIGIIISSTRDGRFGERVAQWISELAAGRGDMVAEVVDLRDYPLPFYETPTSPRFAELDTSGVRAWAAKMASLDGYVFVSAEYNHGPTAVLKNALDHIYQEPARKPAAFVGYGSVGGARAVEQLRLVAVELGMVPLKSAVHINMEPFVGLAREGKAFEDYPYLAPAVGAMFDDLSWYAATLKAGREATDQRSAA